VAAKMEVEAETVAAKGRAAAAGEAVPGKLGLSQRRR